MTLVPETEAIGGLMVIEICQEGDKQEDLSEFPLISWRVSVDKNFNLL